MHLVCEFCSLSPLVIYHSNQSIIHILSMAAIMTHTTCICNMHTNKIESNYEIYQYDQQGRKVKVGDSTTEGLFFLNEASLGWKNGIQPESGMSSQITI